MMKHNDLKGFLQFVKETTNYNTVGEAVCFVDTEATIINQLKDYPTIYPFTPIEAAIEEIEYGEVE